MSIPLDAVREVAQLLQESGLHEIILESSEGTNAQPFRLKVRREAKTSAGRSETAFSAKPPAPPVASLTSGTDGTEAASQAASAPSTLDVVSTAVGIFKAPSPAPRVGDTVKRKQVIAIVESLKIPNEILAPADSKVIEILAEPESGVEYGQVLLRLEPLAEKV